MNNAAINVHVQVFVRTCVFVSAGTYIGVELLGHVVSNSLGLSFGGAARPCHVAAVPSYIPRSKVLGFQFLNILEACLNIL